LNLVSEDEAVREGESDSCGQFASKRHRFLHCLGYWRRVRAPVRGLLRRGTVDHRETSLWIAYESHGEHERKRIGSARTH
jgi:hypothetical protein